MKKMFLKILFLISLLFTYSIVVKAEKAKAPTTIPSDNSIIYATTDKTTNYDGFDFSNISFKNGSDTLIGKTNLYKIKLSDSYVDSGSATKKLSDSWFTAYCLNPNLKNPINGIARRINESTSEMNKLKFDSAVLAVLYNSINSSEMYELFDKLNQYSMETENAVEYTIPQEYNSSSTPYKDMLDSILEGNEIKIKFIKYTRTDGVNDITLTASEINEVLGTTGDEYELTLNDNIFFDQYKTINLGSNTNYNRILWIIEHSYPTLSLEELYADAGVNKNTLESQLLSLSGNESLTDEEKIDGYIYSIVQYAIWNVLDIKIDGQVIGDELVGSTELNKIYKYLITDNGNYDSYATMTFNSKLLINKPSSVNEIVEETNDTIKYGPYSLKSDTLSSGTINLSLNSTKGVKIINESNEEITTVNENEKFYIYVNKKKVSESIILTLSMADAYIFEPQTNRGKVYYSSNPLTQNVISGGIVKKVSSQETLEILVNPKTGINNVAILFIVTLSLFSIIYLLIIKIYKPIKL